MWCGENACPFLLSLDLKFGALSSSLICPSTKPWSCDNLKLLYQISYSLVIRQTVVLTEPLCFIYWPWNSVLWDFSFLPLACNGKILDIVIYICFLSWIWQMDSLLIGTLHEILFSWSGKNFVWYCYSKGKMWLWKECMGSFWCLYEIKSAKDW